jgi:PAS domain S-box-containing protein
MVSTGPARQTADLRIVRGDGNDPSHAPIDFQLIVEQSLSLVVLTDAEGVVQYVNPRFCEVTGYASSEVIGRRIHELGELPPEQAADIWMTVSSGRPWRGEFLGTKKGGEKYWVHSCISPVTGPSGTITNYLAANLDITERKAAEEELQDSETRFRTVAENMYDIVSVVDSSGTIVYQSPSVERVLGYSVEERIGTGTFDYVHPEDLALARNTFNDLMTSTDRVRELRLRARHKDGSWRVLESVARAWTSERGSREVIVTSRDVTERVQFEDSLRRSEERLRALLNNTPIVLFAWDREGRFLTSDGKGLEPLGRAPGKVVGRHITEVYPEGGRVHENFKRALAGEVVVDVVDVGGRWWTATSTPFKNESGEIIGVTGVAMDITDRRNAEIALEESQARLKLALDHAQMTAWEWDIVADELTDYAGEGGPLAASPRPLSYSGFIDRLHPDDRPRVSEAIRRLLAGEAEYDIEFRIRWPDATMHWVIASGVLHRDEEGNPQRLSGVAMDITTRKEAEEALRQSDERLRLALEGARMMTWEWEVATDAATHTAGDQALAFLRPGHSLSEFLAMVHESDRERVAEAVRRTLEEAAEYNIEFRASPAGHTERWMASRGTLVPNGSPEGARLVGVAMDITESKRADQALRESEERYRALYQDNPAMYFTVAVDGTVLSVNRFGAEQLGYTECELVGSSVFDIFHKSDRPAVRRQLRYLAKDLHAVRSWEFRKIRKDGEEIWVREIVRATRGADRQTIFLVVCEDITERRRMEEQMQAMREHLEARADSAIASGNRYKLSFREMTVLDQVADGKSDKEIGMVLGIRSATVSKHVANVLKKMGAASRAEASVRAWREGIIK